MADLVYNLEGTSPGSDRDKYVTYYIDGVANGGSVHVGYERQSSTDVCAARIKFTVPTEEAPANGYSTLNLKIDNVYWHPNESGLNLTLSNGKYITSGTNKKDVNTLFKFAISESSEFNPEADVTYGSNYLCWSASDATSSGFYTLTGEISKPLVPGNTYYLWLYPGFNPGEYWYFGLTGYYHTQLITFTFSGEKAPEVVSTILWAFDGTKWVQGTQRVFDGTHWI